MNIQKKIFHILFSYLYTFLLFFIINFLMLAFDERYASMPFFTKILIPIGAFFFTLLFVFFSWFSLLFFILYLLVSIIVTYFWYKYYTIRQLILLYFVNGILLGTLAIIFLHCIHFSMPGDGAGISLMNLKGG